MHKIRSKNPKIMSEFLADINKQAFVAITPLQLKLALYPKKISVYIDDSDHTEEQIHAVKKYMTLAANITNYVVGDITDAPTPAKRAEKIAYWI